MLPENDYWKEIFEEFENYIKKNKTYHRCDWIKALQGIEVFNDLPSIQKCGPVKIKINFPSSEILFKKEDGIVGLFVTFVKVAGGFNSPESAQIFLNNQKIDIDKNDTPFLFMDNNLNKLKDFNSVLVVYEDTSFWACFSYMLIYPMRYEDDDFYLMQELDRWKLVTSFSIEDTDEEI